MELQEASRAGTRALIESDAQLETSFIGLVVAASECSEDAGEIFDLIDGLLCSGRVRLMDASIAEAGAF